MEVYNCNNIILMGITQIGEQHIIVNVTIYTRNTQ